MPILLKFDTEIKGDSKTDGHDNWITLDSVSFVVARDVHKSGAGTDRDLGNPHCQELSCAKSSDISSPLLMQQACCGKSLGKATIHFVRTGGADDPPEVFGEWTLTDAIVTSFSQSASDMSGNVHPAETFTLNFTQLKFKYAQYDGGKQVADAEKGFDIMVNKALS